MAFAQLDLALGALPLRSGREEVDDSFPVPENDRGGATTHERLAPVLDRSEPELGRQVLEHFFVPWITHAPRATNSPLAPCFDTWSASTQNAEALARPARHAFENATPHWPPPSESRPSTPAVPRRRMLDDDARRAVDVGVDVQVLRT